MIFNCVPGSNIILTHGGCEQIIQFMQFSHDHVGVAINMSNIRADREVIEGELQNKGMTYSFSEGLYHDNKTTYEILLKNF